jgi:hypothetical protein
VSVVIRVCDSVVWYGILWCGMVRSNINMRAYNGVYEGLCWIVYIYMCVCMCMYVYVAVDMCVHVCGSEYMCMRMRMYVHIMVCMKV